MLQFLKSLSGPSHPKPGGPPYNPLDWDIVEESPNGVELTFTNIKTGYATLYTPPGMTAKEILAIPAAMKYWDAGDDELVELYIKDKAAEKERNNGYDYDSPDVVPPTPPPSELLLLLEANDPDLQRAKDTVDPKQ